MKSNSIALVSGIAPRKKTFGVIVRQGKKTVVIGNGAPVVVQSMTNTATDDVDSTVRQVFELAKAGSELVRLTVNTPEAAAAVPSIREKLDAAGCDVPLVGDFHYNGHLLLTQFPECAKALSKYRINPGNVGQGAKKDAHFADMIAVACQYDKPVRIGVNWGSMDQALLERIRDENAKRDDPWPIQGVMYEALITSAIESADRAVELGLPADHIVLSCKVSQVQDLIAVYRELSNRCSYALHLGLTEAGVGSKGIGGIRCGIIRVVTGRNWRYNPHFLDARARRSQNKGSGCRSGVASDNRFAQFRSFGDVMSGMWAHVFQPVSGAGNEYAELFAQSDAGMERTVSRSGNDECCRDGLYRKRPGGIAPCQYRDQPAG